MRDNGSWLVVLRLTLTLTAYILWHTAQKPSLIASVRAQSCNVSGCPSTCTMQSDPQNGIEIVGPVDYCLYPTTGCSGGATYDNGQGCCQTNVTPIVIDLDNSGYELTNAANGVPFRIVSTNDYLYQVSWTAAYVQNAWLSLDRNGNGQIDGMSELFGNMTPQPETSDGPKNGFKALSVYDALNEGGDGDGQITRNDAIYTSLRLWIDQNHDGISEPGELKPLDFYHLESISLDYKNSHKTDQYGNVFRYRSKVRISNHIGNLWAWDVSLKTE